MNFVECESCLFLSSKKLIALAFPVPFPNGWMEKHGSLKSIKSIRVKNEGDSGIVRTNNMGPVIVFDRPDQKRVKARFSVLEPPKSKLPSTYLTPLIACLSLFSCFFD